MQAAIATRYGSPDVLSIESIAIPECGPDDLLVAVQASAVTRGDTRLRAADFPGIGWLPGRLMFGLTRPRHRAQGSTFAGRVVAVGDQVPGYSVGDAVFGECMHGGHAELVRVSARRGIARIPEGVDFVTAATLPYGANTAWTFVESVLAVREGETLVVLGASGGVGRWAVQVGAHLGAHVVAVCSEDRHALVRSLGAAVTMTRAQLAAGWSRGPVDAVLDTSGTASFSQWRGHLGQAGRFATTDMTARGLFDVFRTGFGSGPRARFTVSMCTPEELKRLAALAESGALRACVAAALPLDEARAAHELVDNGRPAGDVVLLVGAEARQAAVRAA